MPEAAKVTQFPRRLLNCECDPPPKPLLPPRGVHAPRTVSDLASDPTPQSAPAGSGIRHETGHCHPGHSSVSYTQHWHRSPRPPEKSKQSLVQ
eukprot:7133742-Prymnesium_polylepis.1